MQVLLHWDRGDNLFNASLVAGGVRGVSGGRVQSFSGLRFRVWTVGVYFRLTLLQKLGT